MWYVVCAVASRGGGASSLVALWWGCGLEMKCPLQVHSWNPCSLAGGTVLRGCGTPKGMRPHQWKVGQRSRPLKWIAHLWFWPHSLLPSLS